MANSLRGISEAPKGELGVHEHSPDIGYNIRISIDWGITCSVRIITTWRCEMKENLTVNILGCCVSREIFNKKFGRSYSVEGFVQRNLIFDIFDTVDEKYHITDEEAARHLISSNFNRRSLSTLMNGSAREKLLSRKGEWIIIDTFYCGAPCALIRYPDKKRIVQSEFTHNIKKIFQENERFKDCALEFVEACEYFERSLKDVVDFLKENWGRNIILVDCPRTPWYLTRNGELKNNNVSHIDSISNATHMCEILLKNLDCYFIKLPSMVPGDVHRGYYASSVHYASEAIDYLKETVDIITDENLSDKEKHRRTDIVLLKYERIFQQIILGEWASERNATKRIHEILSKQIEFKYPEAKTLCDKLCVQGSAEGYKLKGKMYRDGAGVEKNMDAAIEYLRKAVEINPTLATNELADLLLKSDNQFHYKEAFELCSEISDHNSISMLKLGEMYRDGKGVEKDLDKAIEWMRKSADKGTASAKIGLADLLMQFDVEAHLKEVLDLLSPLSKMGDAGAMGRLARMHRDGKGVEKDLDKAIEWMRKSADKGLMWAKKELVDMLDKRGTEGDFKEAYGILLPLSELECDWAMGRLARMHRDGKGVEKDLDKAIEWMRKSADKGLMWAKNELEKMLVKR